MTVRPLWRALAGTLLPMVVATAVAALPAFARDHVRSSGGCGNKLVFLVWPKGHPAIPRIAEFPEIRNPHIELYRTFNSGYDVRFAGAWVIGGKPPAAISRAGYSTECANYGDTVTVGKVANARVITRETALECTFPGSPVADIVQRPRGVTDLYVHAGGRMLARAHVTKTSATLTVPAGRCVAIAPPRP